MRLGWIATCALAVIGGFLLSLRIAWMLHVTWDGLPYAAHVFGAAIAGLAMARQGTLRWIEPFLGGVAAIAVLALVSVALPSAFGWIAMRSSQPWLVAAGIAAASGAATCAGAWLGRGSPGAPGAASAIVIATLTTTCAIMLGARVAMVGLHLPADIVGVMVVASIAAFGAAFATQSVVPAARVIECASGPVILLVLQLVEVAMKDIDRIDSQLFALVIPFGAALLGARAAARKR